MFDEKSIVRWNDVSEESMPPAKLQGVLLLGYSTARKTRVVICTMARYRDDGGSPYIWWEMSSNGSQRVVDDILKWAPMPEVRQPIEGVINESFGRFCISKACREKLGIGDDISDSEIRSNWRYKKELISAVKELGFLANGPGASLRVAKIPGYLRRDEWVICERNGREWIELRIENPYGGAE